MLSDRILIASRKKRGGAWVPEDRLRASLIGAALFVPLSILFEVIILHYVDGTVGLVLICICFFFNGLGVSVKNYSPEPPHPDMLTYSRLILC